MGGVVCKVVIDQGIWGLSESLRQALTDPDLYGMASPPIPDRIRLGLVDKLTKIDIATYCGGRVPAYGLGGIMVQLEDYGLISPDVWEIFVRPTIDPNVNFKVTEDYQIDSA